MTLIRASLGIEHRRLALASTNTGQARLSTAKFTKAEINVSARERYRRGSIGVRFRDFLHMRPAPGEHFSGRS
jgi:hypothetical protein